MFSSTFYLNEGVSGAGSESKRREFFEGENPKSAPVNVVINNWQSVKNASHVNAKWQKLRK